MMSSFRLFILTVGAVLALAGTSAVSAQAFSVFRTESFPAEVTGAYPKESPAEEELITFHPKAGIIPCAGANLHGPMSSVEVPSLTTTVELSKCVLSVSMGGCDFVLHGNGKMDIAGSECATRPIEFNSLCKIRIGPQEGLSTVSYALTGSGASRDVTATFKVTGIQYVQLVATTCGGAGSFSDGELTGTITLKADTSGGKQQGFWLE
jgi:hypothetical protein